MTIKFKGVEEIYGYKTANEINEKDPGIILAEGKTYKECMEDFVKTGYGVSLNRESLVKIADFVILDGVYLVTFKDLT